MQTLAQRRLSVARGIIKASLWAQGMKLSCYSSTDITKAARLIIAATPKTIDEMVNRGLGQLWSPNGL